MVGRRWNACLFLAHDVVDCFRGGIFGVKRVLEEGVGVFHNLLAESLTKP